MPIFLGTLNGRSFDFEQPTSSFIPFHKIDEDSYTTLKYDDEITIVYNERTMGIYFKGLHRLAQLKRPTINNVHQFLNSKL